jgi:hypothetical protein
VLVDRYKWYSVIDLEDRTRDTMDDWNKKHPTRTRRIIMEWMDESDVPLAVSGVILIIEARGLHGLVTECSFNSRK